jgi:TPP-dependent pyruvate/acetoin dehydrogenase alpha subunit
MLVMGAQPVEVLRQYMAKGDAPARGKELNIHFTDYRRGYIGLISHLGVMIEIMAGVAMSFRLRGVVAGRASSLAQIADSVVVDEVLAVGC